jgi:carbamoyl-phosphate synthase large subunit
MGTEELSDYHLNNEKFMFMELVDTSKYKEYTVDAYYNKYGTLICAIPRERIFIRCGEVNKSRTAKNILHDIMFSNLSNLQGARGCVTLQFFLNEDNGDYYGIEINPRFGGGYPLSYYAGGNYPKWIIEEYLYGQEIAVNTLWKDGLLMLRYDDEIIVGIDD